MSESRMRRILLPALIVVLGVIITVVLIKTKPHAARQRPATPRPVVEAYTIPAGTIPIKVRGFGTVSAKRKVNITPQVSGEIVEKSAAFEPGGAFVEGDLLLRIDDTDYALAAAQAEANVAQAEYNLARAEEEAQVARDAWNRTGEGEATELVLQKPQLRLARANLKSAEAARRQAQVNLGRCTIAAPFDGAVLSADADAGQYLRAGSSIGAIYATDVAEVTVSVPDDDLGWIGLAAGQAAKTTVTIRAEFAGEDHSWNARAIRLGGSVDQRSRMVPVVVEVEDPYTATPDRPSLIEGMFVEIEFSTEPEQSAVIIPRSALRPGNLVWVITDDNTLDIRSIEIAHAGVEEAVISAGLAAGERLCVSNLQLVTPGLPIRVEGEELPAGSPAADEARKGGE